MSWHVRERYVYRDDDPLSFAAANGTDENAHAAARLIADALNAYTAGSVAGVALQPSGVEPGSQLAEEIAYFDAHVAEWSKISAGGSSWVLVWSKEGRPMRARLFDHERHAIHAGYDAVGNAPFLVRRVPAPGEAPEQVSFFGFNAAAKVTP